MMSIFTKIGDYFNNRYDIKLERGLKRLEQKIRFDPQFQKVALEYMTPARRTRKLTEWHTWYMGDEYILRYFFTKTRTHTLDSLLEMDLNLFWEKAPDNYIMVHTGWPGIISRKMSEIIFGNGYNINIEVFKKVKGEDGTEKIGDKIDEKESDRIHDLLVDVLLQETHFNDLLPTMAEDESWSGHIATKFSFDKAISPYPIIENADARLFTIKKERGHTTAITFHEWKTVGQIGSRKTFRRDEIYSTVRNENELEYYRQWVFMKDKRALAVGDAVIRHELYEINESKETPIPFVNWQKACPDLMAGIEQESYSFPGLQGMIAFEKPNRMPNNDFPDSGYGASDYSRCTVAFDKLDELYSENAREVRDNKSYTKITKSMLPKDRNGNVLTRNPFQTNLLVDDTDIDQAQGNTPGLETSNIEDKTESISGKWKLEVSQICANAGLSPTSLGIPGFESISADDKSQQEREKATIGTRKKKLELWNPYLNRILLKLLEFNTWLRECYGTTLIQPGIDAMDIDFSNCNVKVSFQDYVQASEQERITTWGGAKQLGVCDTETAVKKIFHKLSNDEQMDIVTKIKFEQGIISDSPEALRTGILMQKPEVPEDDKEDEEDKK
jgi:hypothetical protein